VAVIGIQGSGRNANALEAVDMRTAIMLLTLALLWGCATSKPTEDELLTHVGVIHSKEVVDPEELRSEERVSTGVSASVGSGSGFAIGLGFLFSPWSDSSSEKPPVRYEVELVGGEPMTVYHESDLFEVGDCVEITSLIDDDESQPTMKRLKDGCK
jgi:hypothetical protein